MKFESQRAFLMSLGYRERIMEIAADVYSERDRYKKLCPHDLLDLMHVPAPHTSDGWTFIRDVGGGFDLKEYIESHDGISELVDLLGSNVTYVRKSELRSHFNELGDYPESPDLSFMSQAEKEEIERALMENELEQLGGGMVLARVCIGCPKGKELWFEGVIEDDGGCIELMGPYDYRDGRFTELTGLAEEIASVNWRELISRAVH